MPYSNVPNSQVMFSELLSLHQSLMSNSRYIDNSLRLFHEFRVSWSTTTSV
ncbi:hypothetical protein AM1_A0104 (plasmid) [Acaryochloris marina MBIC11017]|uniref:Uncharacterized protein n=1 Tax=Acaryochloris marina (strain MBIC 11017) TaxID=329726 RepID=A8ZKB3_ACAM1|nr:hypothetical protein AM1_A0104 [Acaryochloris marina MBIC11017]